MATIYERKNLNGSSTWRVQLRRKGYPTFCLSFDSEKDAIDWAHIHEPLFLKKPASYYKHVGQISLFNNREREINRKMTTTVPT